MSIYLILGFYKIVFFSWMGSLNDGRLILYLCTVRRSWATFQLLSETFLFNSNTVLFFFLAAFEKFGFLMINFRFLNKI